MKTVNFPFVIPVIELGFHSLALTSSEKRLADKIRGNAPTQDYLSTPDGWFVPLMDIWDDIATVVEFLWHEANYYDEFNIGGGFLVHIDPNRRLAIPPDSTFRFGIDLANAIIKIKPGKNLNVAVGTQDFWNIHVDTKLVNVVIEQKGSKGFSAKIPLKPLQEEFQSALLLWINFVANLEEEFTKYDDRGAISKHLKFVSGLDKLA